jgi:hypothetical protein
MSYDKEEANHNLELVAPIRQPSGAVSYRGLSFESGAARQCCAPGQPLEWLPAHLAALEEELKSEGVFSYNPFDVSTVYEGSGFGSEGGGKRTAKSDKSRGRYMGDEMDRVLNLFGPSLMFVKRIGPQAFESVESRTSAVLANVDVLGIIFLDAPRETMISSSETKHGCIEGVLATAINTVTNTLEGAANQCSKIAQRLKADKRRFELVVAVRSGAHPTLNNWLSVAAAVSGCPVVPFNSDRMKLLEQHFPPLAPAAALVLMDRHTAHILDASPWLLGKWMQETPDSVAKTYPIWSAILPVTILSMATLDAASPATKPLREEVGGKRDFAVYFADDKTDLTTAAALREACGALSKPPIVVVAFVGMLKNFKAFAGNIAKEYREWSLLAPDVTVSVLKSRLRVQTTPGIALLEYEASD